MDEPTAALDLAHQHAAMCLLRDRAAEGVGVVVVLHDVNLALRYAHEVVVVGSNHRVRQGPTPQVLKPGLIEAIWGTPCESVTSKDGTLQFLFSP